MVFQHTNKNDHINTLKDLYGLLKPYGKMLIQFPKNNTDYYKQTDFVNIYSKSEIENYCKEIGAFTYQILEANLVGYGDDFDTNQKEKSREYFLLINKR
jgi:hypothetical protein